MFINRKEDHIEKEKIYEQMDHHKKELFKLFNMRNEKMLEVINNMRNECHDRKNFVIAGKMHFTTESIDSTKDNIESTIKESLKYAKNLNSLMLKTFASITLKHLLSPEEKHLTSLIQENFKNQPYIVLERDCVLGPGSSLEKDLEDRFRRVYQLETVSTADALSNLLARLDSFHAIS